MKNKLSFSLFISSWGCVIVGVLIFVFAVEKYFSTNFRLTLNDLENIHLK